MDAGFDRVDRDIRDLRSEMHAGFAEMRSLMFRVGGGVRSSAFWRPPCSQGA